jgi:hypothetical protein
MLLPFVPTKICFDLPWQRDTIIFDTLFVFSSKIDLSFLNLPSHIIIFPDLSPDINPSPSVLRDKAETEPI